MKVKLISWSVVAKFKEGKAIEYEYIDIPLYLNKILYKKIKKEQRRLESIL